VTGTKYNQVSSAFWNAVHDTLTGKGTAEENLANLEKTLNRLGHNGKW
jgi:trehalose/maltose transport system substrate-binding protein